MDSVINLRVYRTTTTEPQGSQRAGKKRFLLSRRTDGCAEETSETHSNTLSALAEYWGGTGAALEKPDEEAHADEEKRYHTNMGSILGLSQRRTHATTNGYRMLREYIDGGQKRLRQTRAGAPLMNELSHKSAVDAIQYDGQREDSEMLQELMEERTSLLFDAFKVDARGVIEQNTQINLPGLERSDSHGSVNSAGSKHSKGSKKSDGSRQTGTTHSEYPSNQTSKKDRSGRGIRGVKFGGTGNSGVSSLVHNHKHSDSVTEALSDKLDLALTMRREGGDENGWHDPESGDFRGAEEQESTPHRPNGAPARGLKPPVAPTNSKTDPGRPQLSPRPPTSPRPSKARDEITTATPTKPMTPRSKPAHPPPVSRPGSAKSSASRAANGAHRTVSPRRPDSAPSINGDTISMQATGRVLDVVSGVQHSHTDDDKRLEQELKAAEFNWSQSLRLKADALSLVGSTNARERQPSWQSNDVFYEIKAAEHRVVERTASRSAENVGRHRWIGKVLSKVRDAGKGKPLPECMLKFLGGLYTLITNGYDFEADVFFELCRLSFIAEDYKQPSVIKAATYICDNLSITVEAFVTWLKSNDIQPPPQLLSLLRRRRATQRKGRTGGRSSVRIKPNKFRGKPGRSGGAAGGGGLGTLGEDDDDEDACMRELPIQKLGTGMMKSESQSSIGSEASDFSSFTCDQSLLQS
jgi:hypothetical protein